MRAIADFVRYLERKDRSTGQAASVLEFNQSSLSAIVRRRRDLLPDQRPGDHAILTVNGARLAAGKRRHGGRLQIDKVRPLFADDLLPVLRVAADGHLVAHG